MSTDKIDQLCALIKDNNKFEEAADFIAKERMVKKLNMLNRHGKLPLSYAKTERMAWLLLVCGANPNARSGDGAPLLYEKALPLDVVRLLLEWKADPNVSWDTNGGYVYPVIARYLKRPDALQLLIDFKADVNIQTNTGMNSLHLSTNDTTIQMLIDNKADVNVHEHNDGWTPLHFADSPKIAASLLAAGADPNARDHEGRTPLHVIRSPPIAKVLIENGADVRARDNVGMPTLYKPSV